MTAFTSTSLTLTWSELLFDVETGAQDILSYSLEYDQGNGNFISLIGGVSQADSLATTYTIDSDLTAGQSYMFRVVAKNTHGWGEYSDETEGIPASPPG